MKINYLLLILLAIMLEVILEQINLLSFLSLGLVVLVATIDLENFGPKELVLIVLYSIGYGMIFTTDFGLVAISMAGGLVISSLKLTTNKFSLPEKSLLSISLFTLILVGFLLFGERPMFLWGVMFIVVNPLLTILLNNALVRSSEVTHV
jgi:hypothetical protein